MEATKDRQLANCPTMVRLRDSSPNDAMSWPSCSKAWDELNWKLRYNPQSLTREDQLTMATLISAWTELFSMPVKRREDILSRIKKATKDRGTYEF